jgi:hypothetical protein
VGVVALALLTLGACSAGSSADGSAADSKSTTAGSTPSPLPPGKYQTLPQPCASVGLDTLKKLVPDATDYAGKESLTYDTDRRVGCSWGSTMSDGSTSSLAVDLERVVSYDPAISDEVQAETDFDQKAEAAHIPLASSSSSPTDTPSSQTASTSSPAASGTSTATGSSTATPSGSDGSDADLTPRLLSGLGDAAYIDDVLKDPAADAKTGPSRDVTLVFRTANVVVTITYTQTTVAGGQPPQSAGLQEGAQSVAGQLESRIEG